MPAGTFCFTFGSGNWANPNPLLHGVIRIHDNSLACSQSGKDLDSIAKIAADLDALEVHFILRGKYGH